MIKYSATIRRPRNHSPRPVALLLPEVQTMTDFLLVLLLTASSCLMLEKASLFSHNRDKDGRKLLVFCVWKHIKGTDKMEDMKKFFVYYLERLNR